VNALYFSIKGRKKKASHRLERVTGFSALFLYTFSFLVKDYTPLIIPCFRDRLVLQTPLKKTKRNMLLQHILSFLSITVLSSLLTPPTSALTLLRLPDNHPQSNDTTTTNPSSPSPTTTPGPNPQLTSSLLNRPPSKLVFGTSLQATFKYYGGPIIPNVEVFPIFYGANVRFQSESIEYYKFLPNSTHMDWCK
jgi:hypothetical protein